MTPTSYHLPCRNHDRPKKCVAPPSDHPVVCYQKACEDDLVAGQNGAAGGIRTHDPLITNQELYP